MGEPISTALIISALVGAGTSVATSQMNKPGSNPKPPKPPKGVDDASKAARERQRRLAGMAGGRGGTIKMGPMGLDGQGTTSNTLLGQ